MLFKLRKNLLKHWQKRLFSEEKFTTKFRDEGGGYPPFPITIQDADIYFHFRGHTDLGLGVVLLQRRLALGHGT